MVQVLWTPRCRGDTTKSLWEVSGKSFLALKLVSLLGPPVSLMFSLSLEACQSQLALLTPHGSVSFENHPFGVSHASPCVSPG